MYGRIDVEDALAGTVFALSASVSTGIADISVLGYDLSQTLFTVGGTPIGMALCLSVVALVVAYATNRMYGNANNKLDTDLSEIFGGTASAETYVAIATVVVVVASGFNIMGANDAIQASDALGLLVLAVQSAGYYVVAWMG